MQHRMKDMLQTIRDAVTNGTIVECQGNLTLVCITRVMAVLLMTACTLAQTTDDPFSTPIAAGKRAIEVGIVEFAAIPNSDGQAARMMLLVDEPGTGRLFVNDMRGLLYHIGYDGRNVALYLDLTAAEWGLSIP